MNRKKPLRPRTPLQRRKALKQGAPLKPGKPLSRSQQPLERRTPLRRGRWSRASWEQWDKLDAQAHAAWRQKVTARRCAVCLAAGREVDAHSRRDPHHVIPARYIRRYVRSLRLPADEARKLLRSLLYDPRNGLSLDRRCHDKHETAHTRVPRALIPRKAEQFAREIGMEHVLDRFYT